MPLLAGMPLTARPFRSYQLSFNASGLTVPTPVGVPVLKSII